MRKRGRFHRVAMILEARLLPQPVTPMVRMPLGLSRPNSRASLEKALRRLSSQSFSRSRPPMSSMVSEWVKNSRTFSLRISCFFS